MVDYWSVLIMHGGLCVRTCLMSMMLELYAVNWDYQQAVRDLLIIQLLLVCH